MAKKESVAERLLQIRVPERLAVGLAEKAADNAETLTALCRRLLANGLTPPPAPRRRRWTAKRAR